MNVLEDSLCYLIGAIDQAQDQGKGWRIELVDKCQSAGLKIIFLDPTNKIAGLKQEVDKEHAKIQSLKKRRKWNQLALFMKKIVRQDHRCVDLSDFVIFNLTPDVHTCGSYFEFQSALTQKKPYFLICSSGKENVPSWLFGIVDHKQVVTSIDELVTKLSNINSGKKKLSDRWILVRKQIKNISDQVCKQSVECV